VGQLLGALAELIGALGDVLRRGDQAGVLGGAVPGDRGTGLRDALGELLEAGRELIGSGDQARVLGGAVALDARRELLGAVEEAGLPRSEEHTSELQS